MGTSGRRVRTAPAANVNVTAEALPSPGLSLIPRILITLIAFTPLCLLNGVFLSHDVIPKALLLLCGAALLLFFAAHWLPHLSRLWGQSHGKVFLLLLLAQFVSLTVSAIASGHPGLALAGTVWRRFGWVEQTAILLIALAAAAWTAADRTWLIWLSRAVSICGALAAVYGCLQYIGFDPFLDPSLYRLEYLGGIVRPPASMGHAIYFGAWLAGVTALAASSVAIDPDPLWKRLHAAAAIVCFFAVFLTGSRGAGLAVIVAGAFILASQTGGTNRRRFALAAALLCVAMALVTISTLGGVPAPVVFIGLTPTLVALYQVNVQIPANAPTGNAIPLVLTATDPTTNTAFTSNTVTVAVQ